LSLCPKTPAGRHDVRGRVDGLASRHPARQELVVARKVKILPRDLADSRF
jgi:hypothetical protein